MSNHTTLATAKLASSGLTLAQARHAKIDVLTPSQLKKVLPNYTAPALKFNYLDPLGRSTAFARYRLLGSVEGFARNAVKAPRYVQPPCTGVHIYFPRVEGVDWSTILLNPATPLIITEGELKALKATTEGFPTLGLGGVWAFRSKKEGKSLIDDLRTIEWSKRAVYIVYDSDILAKPDVLRAQLKLAEELGELGAEVYDAGMPSAGDAKVGLDDFLVARSVRDLRNHLSRAEPISEVVELHHFNEQYLYIKTIDTVIELGNRQMYSANAFRSTVAANKKYDRRKVNAQGLVVLEKRSLAKDWMEWPNRAQAEKLDYAPGEGALLYPGPRFNVWRGWGVEPKVGDVHLWKELLAYLFHTTEPEALKYLEQWFAYPLQHPGTKLYTAVAVWGAGHGTGKTLLGESVMLIYGEHGGLVGQDQLESSYSSWLENRQFILGDEITGNDSRQHADRLKGLITSNTITINKKYVPEYVLPNRVNFYFTSNHPDAFFLDATDRRHLVLEAPITPLPHEFYKTYDEWLRRKGGVSALFNYLLNVDLTGFDPRAPAPMTGAKLSMIEENKSDLATWVLQLRHDPDVVLKRFGQIIDRDVFTNQELLVFADPDGSRRFTANAMGRELKKLGFLKVNKQLPVRTKDGTNRYYIVRNKVKWATAPMKVVTAHIESTPLQQSQKY